MLHSEALGDAVYTAVNMSVADNDHTAPDGATTAELLTNTSTLPQFYQDASALTASAQHEAALFTRYSNNAWMLIRVLQPDGAAFTADAWVNLQTGAIGTTAATGSASVIGAYLIDELADSWRRFALLLDLPPARDNARMAFFLVDADNSTTRPNGAAAHIWGYQFSRIDTAGAGYAGPYMPSAASAGSVAADILTGNRRLAGEGAGKIVARAPYGAPPARSFVLRADDGQDSVNQINVTRESDRSIDLVVEGSNGGTVTATSGETWSDGEEVTIRVAWSQSAQKIAISVDGEIPVEQAWTDPFSALPYRQFWAHDQNNTNHLGGWLVSMKQVRYAPFGAALAGLN